jgi:predicted esterase
MGPHAGQPVVTTGPPPGQGRGVVIAVHGRGAGPNNILDLAPRLGARDLTWLAPAAAGRSWYPHSFMADIPQNEPGLSSALHVLRGLVDTANAAGVPTDKIVVLGFSQGACLASEFLVRHAARYGGGLIFTGGLIGPPGTTWDYPGGFAGTPVFLGCSDVDHHVPKHRVDESADVFRRLGATVNERIYPGMGHIVNDDEIAEARKILDAILR